MKKGIFGRAFANAPIFALGYFTNDALTPNLNKKIKEAKQALAEAKSLIKEYKADLAEVKKLFQRCEALMFELKKKEKELDDLGQLYRAPRMDVLKEIKNADGRYAGRN
ncbi:hypothetical protein ISN45_Aa03g036240 [Arabidopsis thaliana x Arabidopsis arenosa]|uniref:Uncharacterized protein n=1 Tax=Arabidopsis thaliana x Arabidopsis arenosa TaxID=1240361 RepID=A0A8T2B298_9BRAS|nr:hypothetical protein ISN45_Aa03g036240 [Arabidopsis thaliana x Arabidopsis arenosa]